MRDHPDTPIIQGGRLRCRYGLLYTYSERLGTVKRAGVSCGGGVFVVSELHGGAELKLFCFLESDDSGLKLTS